jgi:hypothetical protein
LAQVDEDDWVLLGEHELHVDDEASDKRAAEPESCPIRHWPNETEQAESTGRWSLLFNGRQGVTAIKRNRHCQDSCNRKTHQRQSQDHQMALSEADIELIRASWIPARSDSIGAGVLLFKG